MRTSKTLIKSCSLLLGISLFLAGCASAPKPVALPNAELPVEDRAVVDGEALPFPDEPSFTAEPIQATTQPSPVVKRLIASSQRQQRIRDWDGASDSIERALRIEPRNAYLWANLAEIKCQQGAWQECIQLAAKSNTLSGNAVQLRRSNWHLMANAHRALGNTAAAQKFADKLLEN